MGLFDFFLKNRPKEPADKLLTRFQMFNGYTPKFRSWDGGVYESELIRAAIHARATHISKLSVEVKGSAKPSLQNKLKHGPNQLQTWGQFLYRASTILDIHNTLFICPVFDEYGETTGYVTPLPDRCEIVQYNAVPYLRYEFRHGEHASIELDRCGIMTKFQHRNDFFGEQNGVLKPTMELISIQNQGIEEAVKNASTFRFMAKLNNFAKPDDIKKERDRFSALNLSSESEAGGFLLFPNTYSDIKQIDVKPYTVDAEQMKQIKENVFSYFGVNEEVLQNKAYGDSWDAFYEGAVEPFAIQFSDVMTRAAFSYKEQTNGNQIFASSNRLQYMSNSDKLAVSAQMADRGLMTRNEIREIWNLPPLPEPYGDQLPIRGEYYAVNEETPSTPNDEPAEE